MAREIERQAALLLPGALFALALLLPWWRHYIVWHLKVEAIYFELHDVIIYASDVLALFVVAVWLFSPARKRVRELPRWLMILLLALPVLATASALWAAAGWLALYHAARLWTLFALALVVATARAERGALLWGLLTSCAIQSGIGLAQFAQQTTLGLRDLGEIIMKPEWSGASVITVNGARVLRAYALTQHPNMLGGLLMVGVVTGCGVALTPRTVRWPTAVAIGLTTLTLAGLLVTFSRAAWLGLAVAGAALLILLLPRARRQQIPRGPLAGLLAALAAAVLLFVWTQWPLLQPRLGLSVEGVEIRSVDERAVLEAGAGALIEQNPWLGVGYAGFSLALWEAQPAVMEAYPTYQPVHRVPLLVRAEFGPAGLLLWLGLAVAPWLVVITSRGRWPGRDVPLPVAAAVVAALTGLTVISWFDFYPWFSQQGRMITWVLWGLLAQCVDARRPTAAATHEVRRTT